MTLKKRDLIDVLIDSRLTGREPQRVEHMKRTKQTFRCLLYGVLTILLVVMMVLITSHQIPPYCVVLHLGFLIFIAVCFYFFMREWFGHEEKQISGYLVITLLAVVGLGVACSAVSLGPVLGTTPDPIVKITPAHLYPGANVTIDITHWNWAPYTEKDTGWSFLLPKFDSQLENLSVKCAKEWVWDYRGIHATGIVPVNWSAGSEIEVLTCGVYGLSDLSNESSVWSRRAVVQYCIPVSAENRDTGTVPVFREPQGKHLPLIEPGVPFVSAGCGGENA